MRSKISVSTFRDVKHYYGFLPTHSVTINLIKNRRYKHSIEKVDGVVTNKTFECYIRSLTKRCFSKTHYQRYHPRLNVIGGAEVSEGGMPHFHLLIEKPQHLSHEEFCTKLTMTAVHNPYVARGPHAVDITDLTAISERYRKNIAPYNMKDIGKENGAFLMMRRHMSAD